MTILAVAAERREFDGLLRRATRVRRLDLDAEFAAEAECGGEDWVLAANGPGPRLAQAAFDAGFAYRRPGVVVSTGYCGALSPGLAPADVFVAGRIAQKGGGAWECLAPDGGGFRGTLLSMDRVAATAEEKSALHGLGFDAVEMEASAVADACASRGLPLFCVRAVSDAASESLPLDLNLFRDPEGRFRKPAIAARAMTSVRVARELMRLDRQCRQASDALGEFLVHCQFHN